VLYIVVVVFLSINPPLLWEIHDDDVVDDVVDDDVDDDVDEKGIKKAFVYKHTWENDAKIHNRSNNMVGIFVGSG